MNLLTETQLSETEKLRQENAALKASIEVKNAALLRASSIFMEYAHHHFAKGTEEGDKKAKKNRALASVMQEALK